MEEHSARSKESGIMHCDEVFCNCLATTKWFYAKFSRVVNLATFRL